MLLLMLLPIRVQTRRARKVLLYDNNMSFCTERGPFLLRHSFGSLIGVDAAAELGAVSSSFHHSSDKQALMRIKALKVVTFSL